MKILFVLIAAYHFDGATAYTLGGPFRTLEQCQRVGYQFASQHSGQAPTWRCVPAAP